MFILVAIKRWFLAVFIYLCACVWVRVSWHCVLVLSSATRGQVVRLGDNLLYPPRCLTDSLIILIETWAISEKAPQVK